MSNRFRVVISAAVIGAAAGTAAPAPAHAAPQSSTLTPLTVQPRTLSWSSVPRDAVKRLRAAFNADVTAIHIHPKFGTARVLRGVNGHRLSEPLDDLAAMYSWLATHRASLGLTDVKAELRLVASHVAAVPPKETYYRFQRTWGGMDIVGGELTVLLDDSGRVRQVTGAYPSTLLGFSFTPRLSPERAVDFARLYAAQPTIVGWVPPTVRPVIMTAGSRPEPAFEVRLAFVKNGKPYHRALYVDAEDGRLLAEHDLIFSIGVPVQCGGTDWRGTNVTMNCSQQQGTDLLVDSVSVPGADVRTLDFQNQEDAANPGKGTFVGSPVGVPNTHVNAVSAHSAISLVYRYFKESFGRSSWKQGRGQVNLVNYGFQYANAFATVVTYNGVETSLNAFGNGDGAGLLETTRCLDVAGHEWTHNLVAATSGLVYENQPGALNEHIADAFGTAVDYRFEDGDDRMGENCSPAGGIRDMAQPGQFQQPAHMNDFQNLPNTEAGDWGGVHVNSGIPNKAFHNFYSVAGMPAAEQIWYRAITQGGLTTNSQFLDFANALITACEASAPMTCPASPERIAGCFCAT